MIKKDIPFREDTAKYFLPWMSFLMGFIAVLALTGGFKIQNILNTWQIGVSGSMTVQIPAYDAQGKSREAVLGEEIEQVLTILRSSEGVLGAEVVSDEQMKALMEPWMGGELDIQLLPLPKLIDVSVDAQNLPNLTTIKSELAKQVPSAVLDSHRIWLDSLLKIIHMVIELISFVLVLLILTATFTVMYSTNASLSVHQPVIALIHMIGAGDFYIAIQYAYRNLKLIFAGGCFGLLASIGLVFLISYFTRYLFVDFYPNAVLDTLQWGLILSVPVWVGILGFITTYLTVLKYLKRFL